MSKDPRISIVADWFVNRHWAVAAGGRIKRSEIEELLEDLDEYEEDKKHRESTDDIRPSVKIRQVILEPK
jgi:hypothetical protein